VTDLIAALDDAAAALLKRATAADKDEAGEATLVTLSERTKAFDSVVKWAMERKELVVPEKTPSKFEQIKGAFDGAGKPRKRRGIAREGEDSDVEVASAGDVNGAEPAADLLA
jgi:hypothetical protein